MPLRLIQKEIRNNRVKRAKKKEDKIKQVENDKVVTLPKIASVNQTQTSESSKNNKQN